MKTIPLQAIDQQPSLLDEVCGVLLDGGLVCLPCESTYRIVADLTNEVAVNRLMQSKRRTRQAPSLVFIDGEKMLYQVAARVDPVTLRLARQLWPGPLTILFDPHPGLPARVAKQLTKATGNLGVRVPQSLLLRRIVGGVKRPLLVSSANREARQGAGSAAQVRKNFANRIEIFIEAGDLRPGPASTVVAIVDGQVKVTRPGAIDAERVVRVVYQSEVPEPATDSALPA
ncbi:MAG: threonylcarbamoyl-AMP synthase [Deltaproteobacteria bacterium]|nr:threonylcarbamoyl-AMP synthase [Deltaproteobacteria bacterium]